MKQKHIVAARVWAYFIPLWDALVERLEKTGETIVRAKFSFVEHGEYKAVVWTKREKGCDHADA